MTPEIRNTVVICVATYRRPTMLAGLLRSLTALRFDRSDSPDMRVIVVDNDADGSAEKVVEAARPTFPWNLAYLIEPVRNISLARNAGVERALAASPDFVAFVDDDETVSERWLDEMLFVQRTHGADAVFGPVLPKFEDGTEAWVVKSGFFGSERYPTGTLIDYGMTSNALVSAGLFEAGARAFDPRFGLSGGGDTHFFMRAHRAGARFVWADDATVEEEIPGSRARTAWILNRAFRVGHAYVACRRDVLPLPRWLLPSVAAAFARIVVGLILLPVGLFRGRAEVVGAMRKVMHGLGALTSVAGVRYHEYRTSHGR